MNCLLVKKTELYKKLETKHSGDIKYSTSGSAGIDLRACIEHKIEIPPWSMAVIPCGIQIAIPDGMVGLIFPRSGLARDFAVDLANSVGVIDSDYRGVVAVMVRCGENRSVAYKPFVIQPMDRIAQLVVMPYERAEILFVEDLPVTGRGDGGFGSTGR